MVRVNAAAQATDRKWGFLEGVFLSNAIRDAFARHRVYKPGITEKQKRVVQEALQAVLRRLAGRYISRADEEKHIRNIRALWRFMRKACPALLNQNCVLFGVAQKALNSWLKYLWCEGRIEMPPHCPFDKTIIDKLTLPSKCGRAWTKGSEADYRAWVSAARNACANGETLAEWELREWA